MSAQLLALLTALAWGVGGYLEKRGLHEGQLSPEIGITLRTVMALVLLSMISWSQWKLLPQAGPKSLLYILIGGGVIAGTLGMLCFYGAIHRAPLSQVMPIAFTAPLFGAVMAIIFSGEPLTAKTAIGMTLTISGIVVLTMK